jgi:hypothetical protein
MLTLSYIVSLVICGTLATANYETCLYLSQRHKIDNVTDLEGRGSRNLYQ